MASKRTVSAPFSPYFPNNIYLKKAKIHLETNATRVLSQK